MTTRVIMLIRQLQEIIYYVSVEVLYPIINRNVSTIAADIVIIGKDTRVNIRMNTYNY